jgi:hypothetical protein
MNMRSADNELVPSVTKFAFLTDPRNRKLNELQIPLAQAAAHSLCLNLLNVNAYSRLALCPPPLATSAL